MLNIDQLPQLIIKVDERPLAPEIVQRLTKVRIKQCLSLPTQCELTFHEPSNDLNILKTGTALQIELFRQKKLVNIHNY